MDENHQKYDIFGLFSKQVQQYHGSSDPLCPLISESGHPWCPLIQGAYIIRIQATISTIRRVVDQVCALKCTVAGSKPSMRPVRYREVRSIPLKYVRNFIFDPFLRFFPFDSLGCVPENPCPDCRGVRIAGRPDCRGSTVEEINYFWCPSCHANFCDYHRGDLPGWCAQSNMVLEIKWQCQK